MPTVSQFEDLEIWREGHLLVNGVYHVSGIGRFAADRALRDQIRRAAISVTSNIAEGFGRNTNKQFIQFLYFSKGSISEMRNQLYIALDQGYIESEQFKTLNGQAKTVNRKIASLIHYLNEHPKPKQQKNQ